MLSLQRHNCGAEFDPGGPGGEQPDAQQRVEVTGDLRDPGGVHAGGFGPFDVADHSFRLAGGVAPFRADHHSDAHWSSTGCPVSERISRTRTSNGVPVGNTAAAPASSNFGTSA